MPHHLGSHLFARVFLSLLLITSSVTLAGEVIEVSPIDFGSIDLNPGGDTILIAAETGRAAPRSAGNRSLVTGGSSGRLTLVSSQAGHVVILYPEFITLAGGGHTLTVKDIPSHSQYAQDGVDFLGNGSQIEINIGGVIEFRGNETRGSYNGSMAIQLNFE